ncbi:hypothetical protein NLX86_03370 [Streptomyces sp. A3M-1-3]|uniref:hypothetical protein n=1 Tax=Streptomyces sp. A3M-1-3 TaxID=2962044 RepID=UPI0020B79C97|nr:hypothetical protein [Streptomyces sp. A3M-1-3]MCP3817211.1 hypothetical protein [Streptomyces sp. A3M-1-3]
MQTSDVPDLAHTRTRPAHWLATATAMAAVVAVAGLLQPDDATASQAGGPRTVTTAGPELPAPDPAAAPDPAKVDFPLDCGGAKELVTKQGSGDLDGDGRPESVVVVRCEAGSGTPPSGVYVLARQAAQSSAARIVATLVDPAEKLSVGAFAVRDGTVTATLFGYSSQAVPRCCPDERRQVKWRWADGKFLRADQARA